MVITCAQFYPSPVTKPDSLIFPAPTSARTDGATGNVTIATFPAQNDPAGVPVLVPHMEHFYDNSLQTGLMRELAIDLQILGEHVVLLGNQARNDQTVFYHH
jgi:hypothetical protein